MSSAYKVWTGPLGISIDEDDKAWVIDFAENDERAAIRYQILLYLFATEEPITQLRVAIFFDVSDPDQELNAEDHEQRMMVMMLHGNTIEALGFPFSMVASMARGEAAFALVSQATVFVQPSTVPGIPQRGR